MLRPEATREPVTQIGLPPSSPRPGRIRGIKPAYSSSVGDDTGSGSRNSSLLQGECMDKLDVAGVEVSAKVLVIALKNNGQMRSSEFPNTAAGHKQVIRYLRRYSHRVRACMESTGLYGLDLALALHAEKGAEIMVANPRSVRHFGEAMMQRSKTDPIDAKLLAEYAERMPFHPWQPPSKSARQLCAIARAIHQLTEINTMQKNQLHAAGSTVTTPKIIGKELRRSLAHQERAIERLMKEALRLLQSDPLLQKRFQLLLGIRGIKELSAVQLLGELVLIPADCDVRQWVAYAGLDPRQYRSGDSVEKSPHQQSRQSPFASSFVHASFSGSPP